MATGAASGLGLLFLVGVGRVGLCLARAGRSLATRCKEDCSEPVVATAVHLRVAILSEDPVIEVSSFLPTKQAQLGLLLKASAQLILKDRMHNLAVA